jgi:hypothetical protein
MRARSLAFVLAASGLHAVHAQVPPFVEDTESILVQGLAHSMSAFWGDYDNDGDLDLLVANTLEEDLLFRNELRGEAPQRGVFTPFTLNVLSLPPGSVNGGGWVDIDRDNDLDLVTTSIFGAALLLNTGVGDVPFVAVPSVLDDDADVRDLIPGDYDLDGDADLVFLRRNDQGNRLFRNDGEGALTLVPGALSEAFDDVATGCWADVVGDRHPELFVANVTPDPDRLYVNVGGVLEEADAAPVAENAGSQSCAWGDYDGDGDLDLFVGKEHSYSGIPDPEPLPNLLYRNDDGVLVAVDAGPVTSDVYRSVGSAWGDVDNDLDLDLVVSNHGAPEHLYLNDGNGHFAAFPMGAASDGRSMGVSLVDDDEDGDLDLYVANGGPRTDLPVERNRLFRNTTDADSTRRWLQVDLQGVESDRFGVGARLRAYITIDSTARVLVREVAARPWRLAQDGFRTHFGLGAAAVVDSLVIDWPVTGRQVLPRLPVGAVLRITEQSSEVTTTPIAPPPPASPAATLRAYPNPSRGAFTVVATGVADGPVRAEVLDVLGRRITVLEGRAVAGAARLDWAGGAALRAGRYVVRLLGADGAGPTASVVIR